MLAVLLSRLKEQSTHTGLALLVVIVLLAHLAGLDLDNLADSALGLATALGSLAAAAKAFLPEAPRATATAALEELKTSGPIDVAIDVDAAAKRVAEAIRSGKR